VAIKLKPFICTDDSSSRLSKSGTYKTFSWEENTIGNTNDPGLNGKVEKSERSKNSELKLYEDGIVADPCILLPEGAAVHKKRLLSFF